MVVEDLGVLVVEWRLRNCGDWEFIVIVFNCVWKISIKIKRKKNLIRVGLVKEWYYLVINGKVVSDFLR